jgi:hypothetical protein
MVSRDDESGIVTLQMSRRFCAAKTRLFFDVAIVLGGACLELWRILRFRRDQRWAEAGSQENRFLQHAVRSRE